jgi:hypothetical protein
MLNRQSQLPPETLAVFPEVPQLRSLFSVRRSSVVAVSRPPTARSMRPLAATHRPPFKTGVAPPKRQRADDVRRTQMPSACGTECSFRLATRSACTKRRRARRARRRGAPRRRPKTGARSWRTSPP